LAYLAEPGIDTGGEADSNHPRDESTRTLAIAVNVFFEHSKWFEIVGQPSLASRRHIERAPIPFA